jgi:hypothetical protein
MQRPIGSMSPSSFLPALALGCALASSFAPAAQAQLIQRERSSDKAKEQKDSKDAAHDDDDILAPVKSDKKGDKKADEPAPQRARAWRVGVVPLVALGDAGKPLADQVTAGVMKQLADGSTFDAVPLAVDVKSGAGPALDEGAAKQAVTDGRAALEKGLAFVEKLQFGKARRAFEVALEMFEKGAPALADPQLFIDARVGLAEVAARQGQESETEIQLAYAAALNPELELDKKKYPAQFIRTHQKVREKLLKDKRGTIVVDASGAGAAVEVDGRPTAGAPVKVTEVPQGRHLVRVVREGLPGYGTMVTVKPGEEITVSPGFVAKDGKSYLDDLQNNRLSPAAAQAVAEAARAQGLRGAVVGVVSKTSTSVPVQLMLVDAQGAGTARLPKIVYQGDLLDISIETLKAREAIEELYGADKPDPRAFGTGAIASLLEGAKVGSALATQTVALRYDVRASRERAPSRVVTDEKKPDDDDLVEEGEGGRQVLSAGKRGTRKRIEDEDDPYRSRRAPEVVDDPDAPITEQAWFWPTVIGGGAAAALVISTATVAGLVAAKVLPDPRPANGAQVTIVLP